MCVCEFTLCAFSSLFLSESLRVSQTLFSCRDIRMCVCVHVCCMNVFAFVCVCVLCLFICLCVCLCVFGCISLCFPFPRFVSTTKSS